MDEEGAVKAPVTRLRRRLSVELSEDTKSPSNPSTPTKKRGGRLAAKPQLELIDENVSQNSPQKRSTRKSIVRDIAEQLEEKVTPSRRSTRIRSNTSLVADTVQAVDSPRAKRAARRTSTLDSDNEATATPTKTTRTPARKTRQDSATNVDKKESTSNVTPGATPGRTRRTRKDSASSIDKLAEIETSSQSSPEVKAAVKQIITEVISEEPENDQKKFSGSDDGNDKSSPIRKSPRLQVIKYKKDIADEADNNTDKQNDIDMQTKSQDQLVTDISPEKRLEDNNGDTIETVIPDKLTNFSGVSMAALITDRQKSSSKMNKSVPAAAAEELNNSTTKRHRTKSWTNITVPMTPNENIFFSDNEGTKKNLETKDFAKRLSNQEVSEENKANLLNTSSNKKNRQSDKYSANKSHDKSLNATEQTKKSNSFVANTNKLVTLSSVTNNNLDDSASSSAAELLFQEAPNKNIESKVFIEDSDSNTTEDQCVPVVKDTINKDTNVDPDGANIINLFSMKQTEIINNTCEPMDIDETIPENITLNTPVNTKSSKGSRKSSLSTETLNSSLIDTKSSRRKSSTAKKEINYSCQTDDKESHKSAISFTKEAEATLGLSNQKPLESNDQNEEIQNVNVSSKESTKKHKRKSSIGNLQESDNSGNENKSTLVLSQIKDNSTTNNNELKPFNESNNELSKSRNIHNIAKDTLNRKSITYLTSTPVQQKDLIKAPMHINTSIITPPNKVSKKFDIDNKNVSKDDKSNVPSKTINVSKQQDSDEDSSTEKSNFLDDEAEEASDDYESGDSRDSDELQYEIDHEILEKGETLSTEDDMSDESDYEKDSFIVSSDEEDENLLSGSGDDLDLSDNELTMSAKSKKKYDEKCRKEQKKASKEMYESRHKLNESNKTSKTSMSKRNRLESSVESETEVMVPPKKNKRMRLDSNWDSSAADETDFKKADLSGKYTEEIGSKKNSKKSLESASEANITEKQTVREIFTTANDSVSSGIGRKKKKGKRLSESFYETEIGQGDNELDINASQVGDISGKKKTSKRLSNSICNQNNEKEITICDTSNIEIDPLLMSLKQEPKTPRKSFDISTVNITVREDMEQVTVNENTTIVNANDSVDPLQATIAQNDIDTESSLSENEEVLEKYNSILNDLNGHGNKPKIKTNDTSLNIVKKTKKTRNAIVDQLNLTDTKKYNIKNKSNIATQKAKNATVHDSDNESACDSIDLKLLFSEDSNDSETVVKNYKTENSEIFIPLKRTEGQTNILKNINNETLNNSSTKKKREKKSRDENTSETDMIDEDNIFFVDTVGIRLNTSVNSAINNSKNNKKLSASFANKDDVLAEKEDDDPQSDDGPVEILYKSEKNEKLNVNKSPKPVNVEELVNESLHKKNKKKKKLSESMIIEKSDTLTVLEDKKNVSQDSKKEKLGNSGMPSKVLSKENLNIDSINKTRQKRKRDSIENVIGKKVAVDEITGSSKCMNESMSMKKKQKRSQDLGNIVPGQSPDADSEKEIQQTKSQRDRNHTEEPKEIFKNKKKKNKVSSTDARLDINGPGTKNISNKKRKERDDDEIDKKSKILKNHSLDNVHIPRLPNVIIDQLEDKPKEVKAKRPRQVVSTTQFIVEDAAKQKKKPSNYLEESVYMNTDLEPVVPKKKTNLKKPKVLPFMPTASTSDYGFTTKFQVNVIPQKVEFIARATNETNFKDRYLKEKKLKKLRTYELYKQHRNVKLSKF